MNCNVCGAPVENGVCTYCGAVVGSPQEASGMQQPGMGQTGQMNPMQNNVSMKPIKSKTTTSVSYTHLDVYKRQEYMKVWNITLPQIYEQAKRNTPKLLPYVLQTMLEVLGEFCDALDTNGALPMYVLTNQLKMNGAACILYPDALRECSQKMGSDLLILPSSIHEVILLPDDGSSNREELREMVDEINRTQLEVEEVLSAQVYRYERKTNRIIM